MKSVITEPESQEQQSLEFKNKRSWSRRRGKILMQTCRVSVEAYTSTSLLDWERWEGESLERTSQGQTPEFSLNSQHHSFPPGQELVIRSYMVILLSFI